MYRKWIIYLVLLSALLLLLSCKNESSEFNVAEQSTLQAQDWIAANQGDIDAQFKIGMMFANGEGRPKDDIQALEWFSKAAEQGNANAQYKLGLLFATGEGLPKNNLLAYAWLNVASTVMENGDARKAREKIEKEMTPEQIAEAQRLSSNWRPGQKMQ